MQPGLHVLLLLSKEELLNQKSRRIKDDALERFIVDYIASQDADEIAFTWHGGEPTLMGLPFFQRVVELQEKHLPLGRRISNDLQTNGTLLDDDWYRFLKQHSFLVGLSIDGPRELHDFYRPTKKGKPTFDKVFEATQRLKSYGIQFSTLTTVKSPQCEPRPRGVPLSARRSGHELHAVHPLRRAASVRTARAGVPARAPAGDGGQRARATRHPMSS